MNDLQILLQKMNPVLRPGTWVFASVPRGTATDELDALATFRESEGLTVVVSEDVALSKKLDISFRFLIFLYRLCTLVLQQSYTFPVAHKCPYNY